MVTYFNKRDMVSFGEYLLSEQRKIDRYQPDFSMPMEDQLKGVGSGDFGFWAKHEGKVLAESYSDVQDMDSGDSIVLRQLKDQIEVLQSNLSTTRQELENVTKFVNYRGEGGSVPKQE